MRKIIFILLLAPLVTLAQLNADFSFTSNSSCSPSVVSFTDLSTGNPDTYFWQFGNGNTSTSKNPNAIYITPGNYTVDLIVGKNGMYDTISMVDAIQVFNDPTFHIVSDVQSGCMPLTVNFEGILNSSDSSNTQILWDFGDGNTDTTFSPEHTFKNEGSYNVSVVVINENGCQSEETFSDFIIVTEKPNVQFTPVNNESCSLPLEVAFTSNDSYTSYNWNFGDGTSSIMDAPFHTYTEYGEYDVSLTVANSFGCSTSITMDDIVAIDSLHAAISLSSTIACQNQEVAFEGLTSGQGVKWVWDFGDGFYAYTRNAVHEYTDAGVFNVQATATLGSCQLIFDTVLVVNTSPNVGFTSQYLDSCVVPIPVSFINTGSVGVNYFWDFGDGATSNLENPNHIYTSVNSYDVTQVMTNSYGCSDTLKVSNHIDLLPPVANFFAPVTEGCIPLSVNFEDSSYSTLSPVVSWAWDFGNGQTSTAQNPSTIYPLTGSYDVSLIVSNLQGCSDTMQKIGYINAGDTISTLEEIGISLSPIVSHACASDGVVFSIDTVGVFPNDTWMSEFDFNNDTLFELDATDAAVDESNLPVLEVNQSGCITIIPYSDFLTLHPPIAKFNVVKTCNSNDITFNIDLTGVDSSVFIIEGVDTFYNQSVVNYTFPGNGNYSASLETYNFTYGCQDFLVKNFFLDWPIADFELSDTLICAPNSVQFNNLSQNAMYYVWELDSGVTTLLENPNHYYTKPGVYSITLMAYNPQCSDTLVQEEILTVRGVSALFEADVMTGCTPLEVNFTDLSTSSSGSITSYFWEFGDGTTSTLQNPSHTYMSPKNYPVTLTVFDSITGCTNTNRINNFISAKKPNPKFKMDSLVCVNNEITFVNQTPSKNSLTFLWNFGDGNTSSQQSPTHVYTTPGVYTITLTATNSNGCDSTIIKENSIRIDTIFTNFKVDKTFGYCPPFMVGFTDISGNNITDWQWSFGDGTFSNVQNPSHLYTSVDSFDVSLIVQNLAGCIDTITKEKLIAVDGPYGDFNVIDPTGCVDHKASIEVVYSNTSNRVFDFGDGNVVQTQQDIVNNTYVNEGVFYPSVILFDDSVCSVVHLLDTIRVGALTAEFDLSEDTLCVMEDVVANNLSISSSPILSYLWNFGDGSEYQTMDVTHEYANGGSYNVSMIAVNEFCRDTFTLQSPVYVDESLEASISVQDSIVCAQGDVTLISNSSSDFPITNYSWLINNQEVSTLPYFDYSLNNSGNYSIELVIENTSGCTSNATEQLFVGALPELDYADSIDVCSGTSDIISLNPDYTYQWSPDEFLSCDNCAYLEISPDQSQDYAILATTNFGCVDTFALNVNVIENPIISVSEDVVVLLGNEVELQVGSTSNNLEYDWQPNESLSCASCNKINFTALENTMFTVTGTNAYGCFDTENVFVEVINPCEENFMYIPNIFTPNYDGVNDVFSPKSVLDAPIINFYVFDRWGNVLFKGNEDTNGWDGNHNGQVVNGGVYVYMIEIICNNGEKVMHKGNVTVLR